MALFEFLGDFSCIPKLCRQFWVIKHVSGDLKIYFYTFFPFSSYPFSFPFSLLFFFSGQGLFLFFFSFQLGLAQLGLSFPRSPPGPLLSWAGAQPRSGTQGQAPAVDLIGRSSFFFFPRWKASSLSRRRFGQGMEPSG